MVPLGVAALLMPLPAAAHSPVRELGDFYGGLLHPVLVPAQALLVVALGLFLWRCGPGRARTALMLFLASTLLSLGSGWWIGASPVAAAAPLGTAAAAGLAVALAARLPGAAAALLAVVAGVILGLDTAPEAAATPAAHAAFLAGAAAGAVAAVMLVVALVLRLPAGWRDIAARVAGSWTAAVSLLVLSLTASGAP